MDWGRSYTAKWRVMHVEPETWADDRELPSATSISVSKDGTDSVPLLETGTMDVDMDIEETFTDGWYRIEMLAIQYDSDGGRNAERYPIATLLFQASSDVINRGNKVVSLNGHSALKPAADRMLLKGTYAPKGIGIGYYCRKLLGECTPAPVIVDSEETYLSDHFVFDVGMSYLEAIWQVLDGSGWCMQIDGYGQIHILKRPTEPALVIDRENSKLLSPEISGERDISDVPNRYYVVDGEETVIVTNENPASPSSYQARGNRWIDYVDSYPVRLNGETLTAYANRQLTSLSTIYRKKTYSREFRPEVHPFDIVRGSLASLDMIDDMRVLSQDITCDVGVYVTETVGIEEVLYEI